MSPELVNVLARRFKVLGDPARLQILEALADGERTVTRLGQEIGLHQANLSKHLALLLIEGFVLRRRDGAFAYYRLAGSDIRRLCAIAAHSVTHDRHH